jgi:hypothetical protein
MLLSTIALLSRPLPEGCVHFPSAKGGRVLQACRPGDELQLTVLESDGRSTSINRIEADMVSGGVPTGPAAWSPSGDRVALEIGLDEEPGILLIDLTGEPSAIFVDRVLVDANVSGAQPQWSASGEWLIFATSGTGDWNHEGVYGLRISDGGVFRLVTAVPRSMEVVDDVLYLKRVDRADPARSELVEFKLRTLLAQAERIATLSSPARERRNKN